MEILKYINDSINSLPVEIKIEFEKDNYYYQGTPVETKVFIEVLNRNNERLDCVLQLTTKNACRFDTYENTRTKIVYTSALEKTEVPIYIIGSGEMGIIVRQILKEVTNNGDT